MYILNSDNRRLPARSLYPPQHRSAWAEYPVRGRDGDLLGLWEGLIVCGLLSKTMTINGYMKNIGRWMMSYVGWMMTRINDEECRVDTCWCLAGLVWFRAFCGA